MPAQASRVMRSISRRELNAAVMLGQQAEPRGGAEEILERR